MLPMPTSPEQKPAWEGGGTEGSKVAPGNPGQHAALMVHGKISRGTRYRQLTTWFPTTFHLFKRGIETGCTGRAYQIPEDTHRNRMDSFYVLIVL